MHYRRTESVQIQVLTYTRGVWHLLSTTSRCQEQIRVVRVVVDDEVTRGRVVVPAYGNTIKLSLRKRRKDSSKPRTQPFDAVCWRKIGPLASSRCWREEDTVLLRRSSIAPAMYSDFQNPGFGVGRKTKPAGIVVYVQWQVFVGFHFSICQVDEG